jgi:catechol 2,3-dioxygenase-like lactoylglutathione lyase family enzyme
LIEGRLLPAVFENRGTIESATSAHAAEPGSRAEEESTMDDIGQRGAPPRRGTVRRMDNVAIVVDDLAAAVAFFVELGLELEGEATVEGSVVDSLVGLEGVRSGIAMMRTPDGHGRIELTKYHAPPSRDGDPRAPTNTLGMHRVMFAVDDMDDILERLRPHGAELIGDLVRYEDSYRLCYLRGPVGIVVALAEQIG